MWSGFQPGNDGEQYWQMTGQGIPRIHFGWRRAPWICARASLSVLTSRRKPGPHRMLRPLPQLSRQVTILRQRCRLYGSAPIEVLSRDAFDVGRGGEVYRSSRAGRYGVALCVETGVQQFGVDYAGMQTVGGEPRFAPRQFAGEQGVGKFGVGVGVVGIEVTLAIQVVELDSPARVRNRADRDHARVG